MGRMEQVLLAPLLGGAVTILLVLALRPLASTLGLIDKPGGRKTHHGEVPVIGGLAMFGGLVFGLMAALGGAGELAYLLLAASLLVLVGSIDDRFDLHPSIRLIGHLCAGLVMALGVDLHLESLGDIFGLGETRLGEWSLLFTLMATTAAINAFNMMDGMDGLAGGLAMATIVSMAVTAGLSGMVDLTLQLAVVSAVVGAFLLFNLPVHLNRRLRTFMGDAGSTLLGFIVAWFGISVSQGDHPAVQPVVILWLSAVPLMELFTSFTRRLMGGRSPFSADADHFHHMLVRAGFPVRATFVALVGLQVVLCLLGLLLMALGVPESVSLVLLVAVGIACSLLLLRSEQLVAFLPRRLRRRDGQQLDLPI